MSTPIHFVSLGCPKNLVDSEVMLGQLVSAGYVITKDPKKAKVIVINTCGFIHDAKHESLDVIQKLLKQKETGCCTRFVVCGCLVQREPEELSRRFPAVDAFLGTNEIPHILSAVEGGLHKRVLAGVSKYLNSDQDKRIHTGASFVGVLKIAEGCNRRCSFCVIPKLRGNLRSRTVPSLVKEARALVSGGVRELSLVAQDLSEYGTDLGKSVNLPVLVRALCRIKGLRWLRLHYVYPDEFPKKLIAIMKKEKKVTRYLDLPIQHTSDKILTLMSRRTDRKSIFQLIRKLRKEIPEIVLRTSIIVGFPGETEEDFGTLVSDLKKLQLDHVGVFTYSREAGAAAAELPGQITEKEKIRRLARLTRELKKIALVRQKRLLNRVVPVLIEGACPESPHLIRARYEGQAQEVDGVVYINKAIDSGQIERIRPGDFVRVKITRVIPPDYLGTLVG